MAKNWYVGASSVAHKVQKMYVGVNGVAHKVKKAYIGDANGKARLCWSGDETQFAYYSNGKFYLCDSNGTVINSVNAPSSWDTNQQRSWYDSTNKRWVFAGGRFNSTQYVCWWDGNASIVTSAARMVDGQNATLKNGKLITMRYASGSYSIVEMDYQTGSTTQIGTTWSGGYRSGYGINKNTSTLYYTTTSSSDANKPYKVQKYSGGSTTNIYTGTQSYVHYRPVNQYKNYYITSYDGGTDNQFTFNVLNMNTNTYVTAKVSVGYTVWSEFLGCAFGRIYCASPKNSTYTSDSAHREYQEMHYIPIPTQSGTFTRTIVMPSNAPYRTDYTHIDGGDKFAVIDSFYTSYPSYYSRDGVTWTSIGNNKVSVVCNDVPQW